MNRHILDSSAVIAFLRKETGYEKVVPYLEGGLISTVNLAEVFCKPRENNVTVQQNHALSGVDYFLRRRRRARVTRLRSAA